MTWGDFRGFLTYLENIGELKRISKEVDPKFEVNAYSRRSCDVGGPAFLFEKVKGFRDWRYATAIYATRRRVMDGMGCDAEGDVVTKYRGAVATPILPRIVSDGPCKEVVMKGDDVNLALVPLAWHSERDAGYYITSAVEIAKNPGTGTYLLGIHRLQLRNKNTLAFWGPAEKRIGRAFLRAQDLGKPLDIAITLGNDPVVDLASQAKVPHDVDKMAIAGGLKGSPIELVKCETIDIEVPKGCEVVIEGQLLPNSQELEGPFGEVTGVYSGTTKSPSIRITAITMRKDPIMHTVLAGNSPSENSNMVIPAMLEAISRVASLASPEVKAVNVMGNSYYTILLSIKKRHEGEPWNVISAVLGGVYPTKYCYVFDDDIDVYDPNDVQWAIETRMQPHKDVHVFPVMVGAPLDPSAPMQRHSSKMGFNCTIPLDADKSHFQKVKVPGTEGVTW
jgi:2,5-furandicarboxylate decarboxylase 1